MVYGIRDQHIFGIRDQDLTWYIGSESSVFLWGGGDQGSQPHEIIVRDQGSKSNEKFGIRGDQIYQNNIVWFFQPKKKTTSLHRLLFFEKNKDKKNTNKIKQKWWNIHSKTTLYKGTWAKITYSPYWALYLSWAPFIYF